MAEARYSVIVVSQGNRVDQAGRGDNHAQMPDKDESARIEIASTLS